MIKTDNEAIRFIKRQIRLVHDVDAKWFKNHNGNNWYASFIIDENGDMQLIPTFGPTAHCVSLHAPDRIIRKVDVLNELKNALSHY